MKKKIINFLLCVCLILPSVIDAKTYNDAKRDASVYMKNLAFVSSYDKYIYTKNMNISFYDVHESEIPEFDNDELFKYGGLLSQKEFQITDTKYDNNGNEITGFSYLYSTTPFWTLTSRETNFYEKYVVDSILQSWHDKNDNEHTESIEVKVTEYVQPETRVTGAGTYTDPWYFNPKFKVSIAVNDANKGKIVVDGIEKNRHDFIYNGSTINSAFSVKSLIESGFNYLGNTCPNIIIDKGDDTFSISNVTSDVSCLINFGFSQYNIVFNPGNCLGTLSGTTNPINNIIYNEPTVLNNNGFICQGYSFKEWNTKVDGTGDSYNNNASVKELCSDNNCVVNLYAQWENVTSVVRLNQNGATTYSYPDYAEGFSVIYGNNVPSLTSVPRREYTISFANTNIPSIDYNYTFEGFYLDGVSSPYIDKNGNGKIWNKNGTNFELKAIWSGNGIVLPNVEVEGKIFEGWYDSANGGTKVGNADDYYKPDKISNTPNSGRIGFSLFPRFTDIKYNIVFNGGSCPTTLSGSTPNMSNIVYNSEKTLTNGYTCSGHNFAGWVGSDGKNYANNQVVNGATFNANNSTTITLTALWGGGGFLEDFDDGNANNNGFTISNSSFEISNNRYFRSGSSNNSASLGGGNSESFYSNMFSSGILSSYEFTATFRPEQNGIFKFDYNMGDAGFGWNMKGTLIDQSGSSRQVAALSICNDSAKSMPGISGICTEMDGGNLPSSPRSGTAEINISAGVTYTFKFKVAGYPGYGGNPYVDNLEVIYN